MPPSSPSENSFLAALRAGLPSALPGFLLRQRWFGGKARTILSVEVSDVIPFCTDTLESYFILARVKYGSGPAETYDIPLVRARGVQPDNDATLLTIPAQGFTETIVLKDALSDGQFLTELLHAIANDARLPGTMGQIRAVSMGALKTIWQPAQGALAPSLMNAEQSNSSAVYEKRLVLKIFRRAEEGLNPDLEVGAYLTAKSSFRNAPPLAGYLEYLTEGGARMSLAMLQGYVANQGDAWQLTLQALEEYYAKARKSLSLGASEIPSAPPLTLCGKAIPEAAGQRIGSYLDWAALLGRRTAELHLALASATDDPDFSPQTFSAADQQALVNSAVNLLTANFDLLRRLKHGMPEQAQHEADRVLELEQTARRRFQLVSGLRSSAKATRLHGDYHLGQVLFTGSDFVIIDFEGEPARPLAERRQKRSPLQDVAGMLRSFHYAAYAPLLQQADPETSQALGPWAQYWHRWVSATFLGVYLETSKNAIFIPQSREELTLLLELNLLVKAVYELGYELNNRPTWVRIPLEGISELLQ